MVIIYFFYGLLFGGIGLTAYLQLRRGGDLPLKKQLPWLAAFGFVYGMTGWVEMFLLSELTPEISRALTILRMFLQPLSGFLIFVFGWGVLTQLTPLPSWTIFLPGVLIVPIAYVITYAATTFVTPSPLEIPIDIWSRYLLYLPGSILAGIGFIRQWRVQGAQGYTDISKLMLGAGLAFIFEAFIVGLIVPAAPYGPASYYNYDRVFDTAFIVGEQIINKPYGLQAWLDYDRVLTATGLPIQIWRLLSAVLLAFFMIRGLDVFDAMSKRKMMALTEERDMAQVIAFKAESVARQTAENWTEFFVNISQRIAGLSDVDQILIFIVENARKLLSSNYIAVALVSEQLPYLELKYFSSVIRTELVSSSVMVRSQLILDALINPRSYCLKLDGFEEQQLDLCIDNELHIRNIAIAPIVLDNNPVGVLWTARADEEEYSKTDLIWLECIADQIVIVIQHGLMTSQLQSFSVIEERARIAREMHDGLAQVLGYLNLQVQTLESLFKKGKMDLLAEEISSMRNAVQLAHADVRENILSLRTTLAHETGLVPAMVKYIDEFSFQTGIEVVLENKVGDELNLASLAEVQLVCIFQEALTNVRKHAKAKKVNVDLHKEVLGNEESIHLAIVDDGIGFMPNQSTRCFGLQTMRERAMSVSGRLIVSSTPGKGTHLECKLPCLKPEHLRRRSVLLSAHDSVQNSANSRLGIKG